MKKTSCIVCAQPALGVIEHFPGYQAGEEFTIYYCSSCDTSFAEPHIVEEKIYDYIYAQMDVVPGYNRYARYLTEIALCDDPLTYLASKEANYFAIKEILEHEPKKSLKILEVGSGLGYLTFAIRKRGYQIIGLDISENAVIKAKEQFGDNYICEDVFEYARLNEGKFDLVILTEVVEHVPNPALFCERLSKLLKDGGKLVITTPNKSAYPKGEFWLTELPPVHLTWFSEESFKVIAKKLHLEISFFDYSSFNKSNVDVSRVRFYKWFYKEQVKEHILDRSGNVISPSRLAVGDNRGLMKAMIRKMLKRLFISFFTNKKNLQRNTMLCVILTKNARIS